MSERALATIEVEQALTAFIQVADEVLFESTPGHEEEFLRRYAALREAMSRAAVAVLRTELRKYPNLCEQIGIEPAEPTASTTTDIASAVAAWLADNPPIEARRQLLAHIAADLEIQP